MVKAKLEGTITDANKQIQEKIQADRKAARKEELETKAKLEERRKKGRERPLLLDSWNVGKEKSNLAKIKATQRFLEVLEQSGLPKKEAEKHLTAEEKALLEEQKFVD